MNRKVGMMSNNYLLPVVLETDIKCPGEVLSQSVWALWLE